MASGKALNAANLQALGAARLAELLLEISAGDATAKRRLRLALAGSGGSAEVAREVTKRLTSIARAKGFIEWQKVKPLATELEAHCRAIGDLVAPTDPYEAFELIWRLVSCAESVLARSDDGSGRLVAIFHDAVRDLGLLAQAARLEAAALAERAFEALRTDGYGVWEELVTVLAPQLGVPGLSVLKERMEAWHAEPIVIPPERERRVVAWSGSGKIHADEIEARHRRRTATFVLQQIADALGDVDSYIAQLDPASRNAPTVAAGIARRLLEAGRPQEAWDALKTVEASGRHWIPIEWEQARVDTLEALGRSEEAQAFRWKHFVTTLNAPHLRAYLRKLPDFEDFDAEQRALAHALAYGDVHQALAFLVSWPDLLRANQLVLNRTQELNGNLYELLSPAADMLEDKHPLAATLLRRAMIDFTLGAARSSRYKHAARHFYECASLARRLSDFQGAPDHEAYKHTLQAAHGRKTAFWQELEAFQ